MDKRALITGQTQDQPTNADDFARPDKAIFIQNLVKAADNLARIAQLLLLEFNFPTTIIFVAESPNLFSLAAQYYGDVRKWDVIGRNSMVSQPIIEGEVQLSVPRNG